MPTTVTASNSVVYHVFQLTEYTTPEPEDTVEYGVITNDLVDGYRRGILSGFTAGTRSWKLQFPTLAHLDVIMPDFNGARGGVMSREDYVRTLYAENKVSGEPFVYTWNSTYYFVDFAEQNLSMQRMRVKLFTTGLTLVQRRLAGVTLP